MLLRRRPRARTLTQVRGRLRRVAAAYSALVTVVVFLLYRGDHESRHPGLAALGTAVAAGALTHLVMASNWFVERAIRRAVRRAHRRAEAATTTTSPPVAPLPWGTPLPAPGPGPGEPVAPVAPVSRPWDPLPEPPPRRRRTAAAHGVLVVAGGAAVLSAGTAPAGPPSPEEIAQVVQQVFGTPGPVTAPPEVLITAGTTRLVAHHGSGGGIGGIGDDCVQEEGPEFPLGGQGICGAYDGDAPAGTQVTLSMSLEPEQPVGDLLGTAGPRVVRLVVDLGGGDRRDALLTTPTTSTGGRTFWLLPHADRAPLTITGYDAQGAGTTIRPVAG